LHTLQITITDEIEVKKQGDFIDFSIVKKTMKSDNEGFYQGSFVRFLEFRVEKLVYLVSFFIMNDFDVSSYVRLIRSLFGQDVA